jgi:hypothetical protein
MAARFPSIGGARLLQPGGGLRAIGVSPAARQYDELDLVNRGPVSPVDPLMKAFSNAFGDL